MNRVPFLWRWLRCRRRTTNLHRKNRHAILWWSDPWKLCTNQMRSFCRLRNTQRSHWIQLSGRASRHPLFLSQFSLHRQSHLWVSCMIELYRWLTLLFFDGQLSFSANPERRNPVSTEMWPCLKFTEFYSKNIQKLIGKYRWSCHPMGKDFRVWFLLVWRIFPGFPSPSARFSANLPEVSSVTCGIRDKFLAWIWANDNSCCAF